MYILVWYSNAHKIAVLRRLKLIKKKSVHFVIPNCQKYSLKECVFVNLALKLQCHIVRKNTLLQTAFFGDFAHWVSY